jgi:hypothetical protein
MNSVMHQGKTLLMTTLAIGCMATVLLWPQVRPELRAQESISICAPPYGDEALYEKSFNDAGRLARMACEKTDCDDMDKREVRRIVVDTSKCQITGSEGTCECFIKED